MKYKKLLVKSIFFIIIMVITDIILYRLTYSTSANIAISQLNGDNVDYGILQVFNYLQNNYYLLDIGLFALFFTNDIIKLIKKILLEKEEI